MSFRAIRFPTRLLTFLFPGLLIIVITGSLLASVPGPSSMEWAGNQNGYKGVDDNYDLDVIIEPAGDMDYFSFLSVLINEPSGNESVSFAVIGDYGTPGMIEAEVAVLVNSWDVDFVTTVGDNRYMNTSYDSSVGQYYCNFLADAGNGGHCNGGNSPVNAFFPATGNHDYGDGGGINEYLDYFYLPGEDISTSGTSSSERYYDVRHDIVHLFFLDSQAAKDIAESTAQQNWLQAALAASTARWKFVFLHHAPFSSAFHGSQSYMQWPYTAWGASAVFAGHDHVYERLLIDGIPYFVNGLGGNPSIYAFNSPIPGSQIRYNENHGAILFTATDSSANIQFINRDGAVIDNYTWSN